MKAAADFAAERSSIKSIAMCQEQMSFLFTGEYKVVKNVPKVVK